MIPKIIHYTWFSNDEMPLKVKECIASWKKVMPDYELRLWNMESLKRDRLCIHDRGFAAEEMGLCG